MSTSDNLKTMSVKVRGEFGAGKSEMVTFIERAAKSFGMQTRLDADGHNLTITSTKEERCRLFAANHPGESESKRGESEP